MQSQRGVGEYNPGEAGQLFLSRTSQLNGSRRPVLFVHGAGGNADTAYNGGALPNIGYTTSCAEAGYPVHGGDYGSATYRDSTGLIWNWGNSDSVSSLDAAVTWLGGQGAKIDKVCLLGVSMGCASVLNYIKAHPTKVLAAALVIPLLDLNDLASNDKGFFSKPLASGMVGQTLPKATINLTSAGNLQGTTGLPGLGGGANLVNVFTSNGWQKVTFTSFASNTLSGCAGGTGTILSGATASQGYGASLVNGYGVTWPALLSSPQLTANSPIRWAETAGGLQIPVHIWSSDNDPIASDTAVCQAWATAVGAAGGGNITPIVESTGSNGHSPGSAVTQEIAAWFDANGGRS